MHINKLYQKDFVCEDDRILPMAFKIELFRTARGDCPVANFIEEQELTTQAKVAHYINLLKENGPYLKPPFSKKLAKKLYELRVPGKVAVRIFYMYLNNKYYLLHAFKKKTQKTPRREILIISGSSTGGTRR